MDPCKLVQLLIFDIRIDENFFRIKQKRFEFQYKKIDTRSRADDGISLMMTSACLTNACF